MNEFEEKVYTLIDSYLKALREGKAYVLSHLHDYERNDAVVNQAISILENHDLVRARGSGPASIIDITIQGMRVLDTGGIIVYLTKLTQEANESEALEREKLKLDVQNSKRIFNTYWWSFGMSVIAFIISVILLIREIRG